MESLLIEGTVQTPIVKFDGVHGFFEIKGKSNPENAVEFYRPILVWLDEYIKAPAAFTTVNFKLEYFNTSSSKSILHILEKFETIYEAKKEVIINWYYEKGDIDMLEAATDYESLIHAPFKMIGTTDLV
jgi:hypothetical protein